MWAYIFPKIMGIVQRTPGVKGGQARGALVMGCQVLGQCHFMPAYSTQYHGHMVTASWPRLTYMTGQGIMALQAGIIHPTAAVFYGYYIQRAGVMLAAGVGI